MKKYFHPLSFEFFPPRTIEGLQKLNHTATSLENTHPQFFSVTFGAGGSTMNGTIESVQMLKNSIQAPIVPHLSCIGLSIEQIQTIIKQYKQMGLNRIVALRGDLPSGMAQIGELKFACELVSLIRKETGDYFHIDVAAYPEIHPHSKNALEDILHFKMKFDAGANSAITQYFFNPDAYFYFRDECIKHHITMPIVPGIMPITHFNNLVRFSEVCGAEIPRWIYKRLESYRDDAHAIKHFGSEFVFNLCERLLAEGAPGLHFYTLNNLEAVAPIVAALRGSEHALQKAEEMMF